MQRRTLQVLVADDDAVLREVLQMAVEDDGYTCLPASNGNQAWELFLEQGADIVISDWVMPGAEGPELCRRVRRHTGRPYTYFLLLTVRNQKHDMYEGLAAGVDDYLVKPFDLGDLSARLLVARRSLELHREREALVQLDAHMLAVRTAQHELNNRLTMTVGFTEILLHDPELPARLRPMAEEAHRGAEEAGRILHQMQELTRVERREWGPNLEATIDLDRSIN